MLRQQTAYKLKKMNMQPMVDAAEAMGAAGNLSKEEWLDILVDRLYEERMATKVNNLIKAANLCVLSSVSLGFHHLLFSAVIT